jgi:Bacterial Ig-like domain (group 1)
MNKLLTILATMAAVAIVAACGGNGSEAGTPLFGSGSSCSSSSASAPSGGCVAASNLALQLDTSTIGSASVKATATATSAAGQALPGVSVAFSVDNGATFTQPSSTTGTDGTSVATVSIGAVPSNRTVTVTATSGSLTASSAFAIASTGAATLTGTPVPAVVARSSTGNRIDFRLVDGAGKPLAAGQPISVIAATLPPASGTTDANGDYSYVYSAPSTAGPLTVVATAVGVSFTITITVQ